MYRVRIMSAGIRGAQGTRDTREMLSKTRVRSARRPADERRRRADESEDEPDRSDSDSSSSSSDHKKKKDKKHNKDKLRKKEKEALRKRIAKEAKLQLKAQEHERAEKKKKATAVYSKADETLRSLRSTVAHPKITEIPGSIRDPVSKFIKKYTEIVEACKKVMEDPSESLSQIGVASVTELPKKEAKATGKQLISWLAAV